VTPRLLIVPFRKGRTHRSGSALLIILGCVALLTILVTAFLFSARTEFTTSNFYAKGVSTKLLSENVINLVMAQLREGARSTDVNTNAPVAWASQPGMIRSYGNDGKP
jgi:type II secretory pathway component PulK